MYILAIDISFFQVAVEDDRSDRWFCSLLFLCDPLIESLISMSSLSNSSLSLDMARSLSRNVFHAWKSYSSITTDSPKMNCSSIYHRWKSENRRRILRVCTRWCPFPYSLKRLHLQHNQIRTIPFLKVLQGRQIVQEFSKTALKRKLSNSRTCTDPVYLGRWHCFSFSRESFDELFSTGFWRK